MAETKEKKSTFTLPQRVVNVVPIKREGAWLPPEHDGEFMYTGASSPLCVPRHGKTGQFINPLNDEEQAFLEDRLAKQPGDLSIYKPKRENYWGTFYIKLDKNNLRLDLSDPNQFIQFKVLSVNNELIAPSYEDRYGKATYRWMLVDEDYAIQTAAKEADLMQEVWMAFGGIKNSESKLRNVLKFYHNKPVSKNAKREFLISEVKSLVETDPEGFNKVITDPKFDMKAFIENAVEVGAIVKAGKNKYSFAGDPDDVYTTNQMVDELDPDGPNNDKYIIIQTQIREANL